MTAARNALTRRHGHAATGEQRQSKEYQAFHDAKRRCFDWRHQAYKNYGARGITMATEWINDFPAFLAHIGLAHGPEYSLDRIDNDRGYFPGNVRWATAKQQRANQRAFVLKVRHDP